VYAEARDEDFPGFAAAELARNGLAAIISNSSALFTCAFLSLRSALLRPAATAFLATEVGLLIDQIVCTYNRLYANVWDCQAQLLRSFFLLPALTAAQRKSSRWLAQHGVPEPVWTPGPGGT
jgi:hypothetical protein